MELLSNIVNRWATSDGSLTFTCSTGSAKVVCGDVSIDASVDGQRASISCSDAKKLMPDYGVYEITIESDSERTFAIERVSNRYTDKQTIIEYGRKNADGFDNESKYTDSDFASCILAAEESIEHGCNMRSFCTRKMEVMLSNPTINELPVVDVREIECDDPSVHLLSYCQASGVDSAVKAKITYGASLDARMAQAATMLAASFLRPRATPENARGTAQDGVYVSYELPTGDEGSWTGLPKVDAAIEEHRARRVMIV